MRVTAGFSPVGSIVVILLIDLGTPSSVSSTGDCDGCCCEPGISTVRPKTLPAKRRSAPFFLGVCSGLNSVISYLFFLRKYI